MPSCVIKWCKNNSKVNKKSEGLTFHTLPTNIFIRDEWVDAIRLSRNDPQWQPSSSSVVCSDHFEETDMYDTKRGLRRIHRTGYPKKKLFSPSNAVVSDILSPNISPPFVPNLPVSPSEPIDSNCVVLPSTSSAADLKLFPPSNAVVSDISSPNISLPCVPNLPVSPSMVIDRKCIDSPDKPTADVDQQSIFDTPRKHKLRQKLKAQEIYLKQTVTKIKTLQQKVRRLQNRNLYLKEIIKNLKTQNFMDTDLHNSTIDLFKNFNRKKAKKRH